VEEPIRIDGLIDEILNRVLPEDVARRRLQHLSEHADAVHYYTELHRKAWEELLGNEVRLMVFDGLSPRLAEVAAKNNLAVLKKELDAELEEALEQERQTLLRKLKTLLVESEGEL
jgi:hypothetical protein